MPHKDDELNSDKGAIIARLDGKEYAWVKLKALSLYGSDLSQGAIKKWETKKNLRRIKKGVLDYSLVSSRAENRSTLWDAAALFAAVTALFSFFLVFVGIVGLFFGEEFSIIPPIVFVASALGTFALYKKIEETSELEEAKQNADPLFFDVLPNKTGESDDVRDGVITTFGYTDFPVEHMSALYDALLKVKEAEKRLEEAEEKRNEYKDSDMTLLVESKYEDRRENLELALEERNEVTQKINHWYQELKDKELTDFLMTP